MKLFFYRLLSLLFPRFYELDFSDESFQEKSSKSNNPHLYVSKKLLTPMEISFYKKLKKIETKGDYLVFPQINLASIVSKKVGKFRSELFRNIDFGIFNSNFDLLLLIELNDKTHKQSKRYKRDLMVRNICKEAGLKLMTFYTSYPNELNYVINRILKEISPPTVTTLDNKKDDALSNFSESLENKMIDEK